MGTKRRSLFTIVFCILFPLGANAQSGPHPPFESASPFPDFAPPGHVPNYRVWSNNEWVLPACTGWSARAGVLVAVAGQFRYTGTADDLLLGVGAISTLRGIRYWSATENGWRTLITSATALEGADLHRPRADFRLSEMKSGAKLYFTQTAHHDSRHGFGDVRLFRDGSKSLDGDPTRAFGQFPSLMLSPAD